MRQYLNLLQEVLDHGEDRIDRTGVGTRSLFGMQAKYDLREGFPLVTTKKVRIENIIRELLWFLRGATNINDGLTQYTKIWDEWADAEGELGPIYGYQWTKWEQFRWDEKTQQYHKEHINQIQQAIDTLKTNPYSRRNIVNAWNVSDIDRMALPPCHTMFQLYVVGGRLDCQLYQRSADLALGVPYNIASYACLMMMFAQEADLEPGVFTHTLGDAHIYLNHVEGIQKQLQRTPHPLPRMTLKKRGFWEHEVEDFVLEGYTHDPFISFPIAV